MLDRVSDVAAFVFRHGALADEILFRDVETDGEFPGLSDTQRAAIQKALPHLRETWIGIGTACREAFLRKMGSHACAKVAQTRWTRDDALFDRGGFEVSLISGRVTCGVGLEAWGEPSFHLYPWVWTQARLRGVASEALKAARVDATPGDVIFLTLAAPKEDETFASIAARTAPELWRLAQPVADAVLAGKGATS